MAANGYSSAFIEQYERNAAIVRTLLFPPDCDDKGLDWCASYYEQFAEPGTRPRHRIMGTELCLRVKVDDMWRFFDMDGDMHECSVLVDELPLCAMHHDVRLSTLEELGNMRQNLVDFCRTMLT